MDYAWSAPTLFLLASAALSALVAGFVGRRHGRIGGHCLTIIMLAATAWSAAYGLEVASRTLSGVELWGALKYVGITVWPPAYLVFALRYTGREQRVTRSLVAALSVQPLLVLGALAAPATRELMFSYPPATAADPLPNATLGPLVWVHAAYCYVLMLVATVLIVRALSRLSRAYRGRSALLVASMALPAGANLLYLLELQPFGTIDPTPFAYVLTGAVLVWAGLRFGLRDVMPVARDAIVETMADGVVVLDPVGRVVDLNPAARTLLGSAADEATGQPAAAVLPGYRELVDRLGSALEGDGEIVVGEGAERRVLEGRISPVLDHRGGTTALLLVLRDITARRRAEEELGRLAHYDQLTGLPNRKLLGDRLEQASARARVSGEPFALVFFDLDGFKVVNDSFGHHAGDCLLAEAAARLARHAAPEDTVARLGGDEFTLLLAHVDSPHAVAGVVSEVLGDFQVPFALRGQSVHVSVSAGIAMCPADAIEADTLLRFADTAMYRAKTEGRCRYEFFTPEMSLAAVQRFELERDLRAALDERELVVHYQPLVPLQEGVALGAGVRRMAGPTSSRSTWLRVSSPSPACSHRCCACLRTPGSRPRASCSRSPKARSSATSRALMPVSRPSASSACRWPSTTSARGMPRSAT
ncbi:MAG: diguanylate cyclase [Thermoleophilaceae bacterium]|nr:diguanylate cyclase [Thermoleophilaceae bacterium]